MIEWTESTWNPVAGCTSVSPGCTNCYAMRLARRLEAMGQPKYAGTTRLSNGRPKWNGVVRCDEESLKLPGTWKTGRRIFVNSMSDLFHEAVSLEFIRRVFTTMSEAPQHTYQILTKRAERLEKLSEALEWPRNVWMGVSVENADYQFRIDHLRRVGAMVKFLSLEPLLGQLDRLNTDGIDWVIAGGGEWPGSPASKPGLGAVDPRPVRSCWRRIPLQAVGWNEQKEDWAHAGRKNLGSVPDTPLISSLAAPM